MAFSLNKIMLIGNLGQDAEHRFTTNNTEVTSFSLATTHSYKGRDGNWVNETTWHNIIIFGASDYLKGNLKKGKKFYVEGRLSKRDYENKDGQKVYVTEVVADKFSIIPLESGEGGSFQSNSNFSQPESLDTTAPEDDDLPF
ncbi:MAG: single-stranded DNA-binding protein [Ignavibacteriae bacterium]|nr:single-stranded DNA-binding protein [Ignavibacteriota bacterium]MCB9206925.1 single-stranded DNA-binding protein [Ignavibacteriales bacterium]MCB9209833.1 single-stranded DNA-binding protein [Ignavibacteriales bacterium]MCB9218989.1 single-stranded DNA-binding protein [Ignavibacteriales bacterium]